jgi:CTP synthase
VFYIHVTLIPFIGPSHELKTKPTQHSVTELRSRGIMPDAIICRSDRAISKHLKEKISSQCDVPLEGVVTAMDAKSLYDIPLVLHKEGLDNYVCELLNIEAKEPDLTQWLSLVDKVNNLPSKVTIGIVGKYINLPDAYLSVVESLKHGGYACGVDVKIKWIASDDDISTDLTDSFEDIDAVVIPGGFGFRGIEGKVQAIKFVRENNIPFLGICLGMQCAVIEYARSFCDLPDANSSEFNPETHSPVIDLMDEQIDVVDMGATMRLGSYKAKLAQGSLAQALYQSTEITERHRHRYEFNNKYREMLEDKGLIISGTSPDGKLVEFVELSKEDHPYFIATQAHPEFKSRPDEPHPLFAGLVSAAKNFAKNRDEYSKIDIREGALEFLKRVTQ